MGRNHKMQCNIKQKCCFRDIAGRTQIATLIWSLPNDSLYAKERKLLDNLTIKET